jgi:hypothetical protein
LALSVPLRGQRREPGAAQLIVRRLDMTPNLKPAEALSQVVFIHDYIQLVFQDEIFSIYNDAQVIRNRDVFRQGQLGFCDALVSLIGQRIISFTVTGSSKLSLKFENGADFHVLSSDDAVRGPEAFEFHGTNNLLVVEQNV